MRRLEVLFLPHPVAAIASPWTTDVIEAVSARHNLRVFDRTQLLDRVWGRNVYVEERTVDVHVLRLRKALMPFGMDKLVETVRGIGYRLSSAARPTA